MIRVLIADDHAVVRQGLKQILSDTPGIEAVAEAADGHEALEKVRANNVDLVILDITMPGKSGLEALTEIKRERPQLPVLMLSVHGEEHYGMRVLRAGASGYLTKNSAPEELVSAIKKALSGGKYVSSALAEKMAAGLANSDTPLHERLSDREYQVLCLMASGKMIKEIAEQMSLSVKTISTYRSRILGKMGKHNSAELIHYAIQHGLVN
ncbi:MAG TPA: response regulator transcription factor [Nitrospirales bacterium]|nr:response regulator transcription factor [Nitrospirales bacterium]